MCSSGSWALEVALREMDVVLGRESIIIIIWQLESIAAALWNSLSASGIVSYRVDTVTESVSSSDQTKHQGSALPPTSITM